MELYLTEVPVWLSALFVMSFIAPVWLIAGVARSAYSKVNVSLANKLYRRIILFYFLFLGAVAVASLFGVFAINTLPPRILILAAIPLFLFYTLYVNQQNWFKALFREVKLEQLVAIHLFRFVGIFFFLTYAYGALPEAFAYIGGGGDLLTAILAIPLIYGLRRKVFWAKGFVWIWNFIGLADIISVLSTAVFVTRKAVVEGTPGVEQFGSFPFSWIPAFAPATIIFLHILIFRKLRQEGG